MEKETRYEEKILRAPNGLLIFVLDILLMLAGVAAIITGAVQMDNGRGGMFVLLFIAGMVKMALDQPSEEGVVELDEERRAQMVSNLLVVLCGNKDAQPIVNSGSIY